MKVFTEDLSFKKRLLLKNLIHIFNSTSSFKPYFIQIIAFLTFVYYNNGIAVGDRSNHEASFHICQLLYFSVFTVGLLFLSHFFQSFKNCFKLIKTAFFRNFILFSVSLVFYTLSFFSIVANGDADCLISVYKNYCSCFQLARTLNA